MLCEAILTSRSADLFCSLEVDWTVSQVMAPGSLDELVTPATEVSNEQKVASAGIALPAAQDDGHENPAEPKTNQAVMADGISSFDTDSSSFFIEVYRVQRCLITHQSRPSCVLESAHIVPLNTDQDKVRNIRLQYFHQPTYLRSD